MFRKLFDSRLRRRERSRLRARSTRLIRALERLEPRIALSFTGSFDADTGVLAVEGSDQADVADIEVATNGELTLNGAGFTDTIVIDNPLGHPIRITVPATNHNVSAIQVRALGGDDQVHAGAMAGYMGSFSVDGGAGLDTLTIDGPSTDAPYPPEYQVTADSLIRPTSARVDYAGLEGLTVNGNAGVDRFDVASTAAGTPVTLAGGGGNDSFTIDPTGGSLGQIQGALTLDGGGDGDDLTIYGAAPGGQPYTVTSTTVSCLGSAGVSYYGFEDLELWGTPGSLTYVRSTAPNTSTLLAYGGTFLVGDSGSVQGIQGALTLGFPYYYDTANRPGTSTVVLDDSSDLTARSATLSSRRFNGGEFGFYAAGVVTGLAPATIQFADGGAAAPDAEIRAGLGADTVTVLDTTEQHVILDVGSGGDAVNVRGTTGSLEIVPASSDSPMTVCVGSLAPAGGGTLDAIRGEISITKFGAGTVAQLTLDDSGSSTPRTATIDNGAITGLAPATISTNGHARALAVRGGSGGNSFSVEPLLMPATLSSGTGDDRVFLAGSSRPILVEGQSGSDVVELGRQPAAGGLYRMSDFLSDVTVRNGAGSTYLDLRDTDASSGKQVTLDGGRITGLAPATIEAQQGVAQVALAGGAYNDTYSVRSTRPGTLTRIASGDGDDAVSLGSLANTVGGIGGVIYSGQGGADALVINDQGTATATDYGLADGSTSRQGVQLTTQDSVERVVLYAGSGGNTVRATGTALGTSTSVFTGSGNDLIDVGSLGNTFDTVRGALTVVGQGGNDTLRIWDSGGTSAQTFAIGRDYVARSGAGRVAYASVESVGVTAGSGNDVFKFADAAGVSGKIDGGSGVNTLDYSACTTGVTVNLATGTATGTGGIVHFQNVIGTPADDRITGNAAANVITARGGADVLVGGGGADTFVLADAQRTGTTVNGGGTSTIVGPNAARTWSLTGPGAGSVNGATFTGVANLNGGTANDTFKFGALGALSGKVNGGGGTNTLDYTGRSSPVTINLATSVATSTAGFLNIQAITGGTGADTLVGPNVSNKWSLTGPGSGQVGAFTFTGVENLTGGSANDTFRFGASGRVAGKVDGGGGVNTLDYSAAGVAATVDLRSNTATRTGGMLNVRAVIGSALAGDRLIGTNAASTWRITSSNAGTLNGTFSFTGVENLTGGAGVDIFQLANGAGVSGRIDGGGGGDWLDYSACTTAVSVNLALGTATRVAGGVANVRNVFGGAGGNTLTGGASGNILVGGVGADTITGGTGRSILIGGKGADKVVGGSGDDVVIGGSTGFDRNAAALASILAEWQSANPYALRINHLRLGGGLNGANTLALGVTVADDHAADVLTGGAGSDWFLEHALDTVTDLSGTEIVN